MVLEWILIIAIVIAMYIIIYKYEKRVDKLQKLIEENRTKIEENRDKIMDNHERISLNQSKIKENYNHLEKMWVTIPEFKPKDFPQQKD